MAPDRPLDYRRTPLTNPDCSTRLFTLLPGSPTSPIQCQLFEVELPIQQPYTALSYEWGPRTDGNAICIDDGIFHIQNNLNTFLLRLRSRLASDQTLTLWVDVICIDQISTEEKNHQEVIAWLGESSDRISRLFERVKRSSLRHEFEAQSNNAAVNIYQRAVDDTRSALRPLDEIWGYDSYENFRSDFSVLAAASYWSRSWIVQEVVLAREVSLLCGTAHLWNTGVAILCCIIWRHLANEHPDLGTMNQMNRLCMVLLNRMRFHDAKAVGERREWMALGHLILYHSLSESHDPRDKVYAFVGMSQDLEQDFAVDYNKSLRQIGIEMLRDHAPVYERSVDGYFGMIVALLGPELQQQQTFTQQVEWTEDLHRSCRQTLPPDLLSGKLDVRLWVVGRVSSVTGLRVVVGDIPDCVGINVTARDYATACGHVSGELVEPRDIVFRIRGTQLCSVYRLTETGLQFVAVLVVIAHPGSRDGDDPAAGDWQRAKVLYERNQLCETFKETIQVSDTDSDVFRHWTLSSLRQWNSTDDPFYTMSMGVTYIIASIDVTEFLVLVEADFTQYLQHYQHDMSWQSETLMLDSKFALSETAFNSIELD